jgi:DNA topoisomerase-3
LKTLVIAEKPSVAQKIADVIDTCKKEKEYYEGKNYIITWALGHLLQLAEPEDYDEKLSKWSLDSLPIIPDDFKNKPIEKTKERLSAIKNIIKNNDIDFIINACDAGREGELIFRNIYYYIKPSIPFKRLWLNSYTDTSIINGFKTIRNSSDFDDMGKAASVRAKSDWLIGMNGTRAITVKNTVSYHKKGVPVLSVGRVQTPVLSILVDREKSILDFVSEPYFEVEAYFKTDKAQTYSGIWHDAKTSRISKEEDAKAIQAKCSGKAGQIVFFDARETKTSPPSLFDLALLQREANTQFGFSAAETLSLAQTLYEEKKALTYPRTDSKFLPEDLKSDVYTIESKLEKSHLKTFAEKITQNNWKVRNVIFNDEKVTDHYAIIPTENVPDKKDLSENEYKLYDLVARRFLMQFYPEQISLLTKVETKVEDEMFATEGKIIKDPGWSELSLKATEEKPLPNLQLKQIAACKEAIINSKTTKPPNHFTDASIILAMETAGKMVEDESLAEALKERGLGTPATRAEIIEKLIRTEVVERKQKNLVATKRGIDLIGLLKKIDLENLTSPAMTGEWEQKLREIEKGKFDDVVFLNGIKEETEKMVEKIKNYDSADGLISSSKRVGTCPICGKDVVEKGSVGWGCIGYKGKEEDGCKFYIGKKILGKELTQKNVEDLLEKGITEKINGFTSKKGTKFACKLKLEGGKLSFVFDDNKNDSSTSSGDSDLDCPKCGKKLSVGQYGYYCKDKECGFRVNKTIAQKELSDEQMRKIIEKGDSGLLQGFTSKAGKKFACRLVLDEEKKIVFKFDK